jgi:hypothetical protein
MHGLARTNVVHDRCCWDVPRTTAVLVQVHVLGGSRIDGVSRRAAITWNMSSEALSQIQAQQDVTAQFSMT